MITSFFDIKLFSNTRSNRSNKCFNFFVGKNLIKTSFFNV